MMKDVRWSCWKWCFNIDIHVGIVKDLFFYASNETIKIIDIRKDEIKDEETYEVDVTDDEAKIVTIPIDPGCKLHGFYENLYCTNADSERSHYIIALVEGPDN